MFRIRLFHLVFLFLWPLMVIAQGHDFVVKNFRLSDMPNHSALFSNIKDSDGKPAALIRFIVRDSLFEIDRSTYGVIKQVRKTGEIWVYVQKDIRLLTIRHPHLGVLRNFSLSSFKIESGNTYDAEIEITNTDYLRRLFGYEQQTPVNVVPETHDDLFVETPSIEKPLPARPPKVKAPKAPIQTHFLIGAGFNALSVMGPSLSMGLEIGKFFIGADYMFGIEKVEGVGVYYKQSNQTALNEAYDYTASKASMRLGVNFSPDASVQVIPQIGASINMISGKELVKGNRSDTQFDKCNSLSAFAALGLRIRLSKTFYLYITPQYDFAVGKNDVYKVLKDADDKIKAWGEGFGLNAGFLLRF